MAVPSVLEYTILSAACQIPAKSCETGDRPARGFSHQAITSYIRRP